MVKKHPSNKINALNPDAFSKTFGPSIVVGKSNNQLHPHKRWRQSLKASNIKPPKNVALEFRYPNGEISGPIVDANEVDIAEVIEQIKTENKSQDIEFLQALLLNDKTTKELIEQDYKISQGITMAYQLLR